MARSEPTIPTLTPDLAIEILNKTLEQLQTPGNLKKLDEAKENIGNDMLKMMQFLFPIVMQIQLDVIKEYGYPETREGIVKFAQMLRGLERDDNEIQRLHGVIKSHYLPTVAVNAAAAASIATESPADDRTSTS